MNDTARPPSTRDEIAEAIVDYVLSQNPSSFTRESLPREESLLERGVLDSAGVIELIVFVESNWGISISDEDITRERMGSLTKLAALVEDYLVRQA